MAPARPLWPNLNSQPRETQVAAAVLTTLVALPLLIRTFDMTRMVIARE
jgi:hypothetical protein